MKWEGLALHVENLFPGVVSFFCLATLFPGTLSTLVDLSLMDRMMENKIIVAFVFVSASYLMGVLAVSLSRLLLDRPSEWLVRPVLLKVLVIRHMTQVSFREANDLYRKAISTVINGTSETAKGEVTKRRERGRIVRSTLVPVALCALALGRYFAKFPLNIVHVILLFLSVDLLIVCNAQMSCRRIPIISAWPNLAPSQDNPVIVHPHQSVRVAVLLSLFVMLITLVAELLLCLRC